MDNYRAAWIALQTAIMQKPQWSAKELVDLLILLEVQYEIGMVGAILEETRPGDPGQGKSG